MKTECSQRHIEQILLASLFYNAYALNLAVDVLSPECFRYEEHKIIFEALHSTRMCNGKSAGPSEVAKYISESSSKDPFDYTYYIANLAEKRIEGFDRIVSCVKEVYEMSSQRCVSDMESKQGSSKTVDGMIQNITGHCETNLFAPEVERDAFCDSTPSIQSLVEECFNGLQRRVLDESKVVLTGFQKLDQLIGGFNPGELIVIGARPSMGKTSFLLQIAMHNSVKANQATAVFPTEHSVKNTTERLLSACGKIDLKSLRTSSFFSDSDWVSLYDSAGHIAHAPFHIIEATGFTAKDLRVMARVLKAEHNIKLLIVDCIEFIRECGDEPPLENGIEKNVASLKDLARELDLPVLVASQINRDIFQRADKRPTLADFRVSEAIEHYADMVLFIHREELYRQDTPKGPAEVIIGKNRSGPLGKVGLNFNSSCAAFEELNCN